MSDIKLVVALHWIFRLALAASAAFLMYHEKDGWGWLVFALIVCGLKIESGENKKGEGQ